MRAFTLVELLVVTMVIIVLAGMIIPSNGRYRGKSNRMKCVNNLKQVGLAFQVFAGDHNESMPWQAPTSVAYQDQTRAWIHFQAISNELQSAKLLMCPDDKVRLNQVAENFKTGRDSDVKSLSVQRNDAVSYFVGVAVDRKMPAAILAGDRNVVARNAEQPAYSTKTANGAVSINTNADWSIFPANKIHDNQGNLLLGDGSVQQASVSILQNQVRLSLENYGTNMNRYVFPQ